TFLVLVRKAASIEPREAVGNWLHGVAFRTSLEARARLYRLRARERQVIDMPHPEVKSEGAGPDLLAILDRELSRLPEKYRLPLVLCDLEGRARLEVSRHLQIAEGTLSSRLARGRKMLAGRLARRGLAVSATSLALVLAEHASVAAPAPLVISTIHAATLIAAGEAATGFVSAGVTSLTEGVLQAMFMTKIKTAVFSLLLFAVLAVSGGILGQGLLAGPPPKADPP